MLRLIGGLAAKMAKRAGLSAGAPSELRFVIDDRQLLTLRRQKKPEHPRGRSPSAAGLPCGVDSSAVWA